MLSVSVGTDYGFSSNAQRPSSSTILSHTLLVVAGLKHDDHHWTLATTTGLAAVLSTSKT
jgi:hypothetical protein